MVQGAEVKCAQRGELYITRQASVTGEEWIGKQRGDRTQKATRGGPYPGSLEVQGIWAALSQWLQDKIRRKLLTLCLRGQRTHLGGQGGFSGRSNPVPTAWADPSTGFVGINGSGEALCTFAGTR